MGLRPAPKPLPMHPRRVRGGVRLTGGLVEGPTLWAAQRWTRVLEAAAPGANLTEGMEYAKLGQTKRISVGSGKVEAAIQGRADRPYTTTISIRSFNEAEWARALAAMAEGAVYAAKLLAGELPTNIEDAFGPQGLRLFPAEPSEVTVSCNCAAARAMSGVVEPQPPAHVVAAATAPGDPAWCKHVCCLGHLLASKFANEPFLIFTLRGVEGSEMIERLRDHRASASVSSADRVPVYQQHVPGVVELPAKPLETSIASFWDAGPGLDALELPLERPKVSHPLLRRLGPSPLTGAQFPLVGLLASCYDLFSDDAMRRSTSTPGTPQPDPDADPDADPD